MPRIIALDYGRKRTGIAVTDPLQIIATGLTTVETTQLVYFLKKYFSEEAVEEAILGYPTNLDGTPTDITHKVEKFATQFQKIFPHIPIKLVDESFTSKMAFQTMIDSGLKQKARRNKALVDEISATILLQGYLEQKQ